MCQEAWVWMCSASQHRLSHEKDTVAEEGKDNEEDGKDHASIRDSAPGLNAIVHDHVPVLTSEDLRMDTIIRLNSYAISAIFN